MGGWVVVVMRKKEGEGGRGEGGYGLYVKRWLALM